MGVAALTCSMAMAALTVLACSSNCTMVVECGPPVKNFEVAFSARIESLHGARVEICRDDGCVNGSLVVSEFSPGAPDASCKPPPETPSFRCQTTANGMISVYDPGALGGSERVRVLVRASDGTETVVAERAGTMVREDYVVDGSCTGEDKECVRYVMRD